MPPKVRRGLPLVKQNERAGQCFFQQSEALSCPQAAHAVPVRPGLI
jgi:hypothetical protein